MTVLRSDADAVLEVPIMVVDADGFVHVGDLAVLLQLCVSTTKLIWIGSTHFAIAADHLDVLQPQHLGALGLLGK